MEDNKITYDEVKKVLSDDKNKKIEWNGLSIEIKPRLSFKEMMVFVGDVVSSCFAADTNEYLPEIKDFSIRCSVIDSYTNIELPSDISDKYRFVYSDNLIDSILDNIERSSFDALIKAIDKKINNLAQSGIEMITKQVSEAVTKLEDMENYLSEVFKDIDPETMSNIASAISDGKFDINKLAEIYIRETTHNSENAELDSEQGD